MVIGPSADMLSALGDVRFGSKADMCGAQADVRFTPESRQLAARAGYRQAHRLALNYAGLREITVGAMYYPWR